MKEQSSFGTLLKCYRPFQHTIATAKVVLGEPAFVKERNTGTALTQDAAIEDALSLINS